MKRFCTAALTGLLALTISGVAAADVEHSKWDEEGGYHVFKDDPLNALDGKEGIARIKVRGKPMRTYLLRPRTSFVPEMLKSVEKM